MQKTKFTVRIDADRLEGARRYAAQHGTTVSRLVSEFFDWLSSPDQGATRRHTPVLDRLTGILPASASIEEYRQHLEHKYGA
jgi:hypothetical protein